MREFHNLIRQYESPSVAAPIEQIARGDSQITSGTFASRSWVPNESQSHTPRASSHPSSAAQVAATKEAAAQAAEAQATLAQQQAALTNQQALYQEEVLRLEQELLQQNVQREQELQARLQELDMEWGEVEEAEARVRAKAAEVWEAAVTSRADAGSSVGDSFVRGGHSVRSSPGLAAPAAALGASSQADPSQLSASRFPPSLPTPMSPPRATPQSGGALAFPAAWANSASPPQLELANAGPSGCPDLQFPAGLPPVYEKAVAIILQHGWEMLHGGENAGPAWTALHWAASEGRPDVCELLLQAGADTGHRDELGKTALDYALENGQHATAEILTAIPASNLVQRFTPRDAGELWALSWPSRQAGKCGSPQAEGQARAASLSMGLAAPAPWMRDEQCV